MKTVCYCNWISIILENIHIQKQPKSVGQITGSLIPGKKKKGRHITRIKGLRSTEFLDIDSNFTLHSIVLFILTCVILK